MYEYSKMKQEVIDPNNHKSYLSQLTFLRNKFNSVPPHTRIEFQYLLGTGDSWFNMAVVERLVELGYLLEDTNANTCKSVANFRKFYKVAEF